MTNPQAPEPTPHPLQARVAELERQYALALDDIGRIGSDLMEEAERRDWCNEYDEFVSELNRHLVNPLPERERPHRIHFDIEARPSTDWNALERQIDQALSNANIGPCTDFEWEAQ
jgi:hypothetical protein